MNVVVSMSVGEFLRGGVLDFGKDERGQGAGVGGRGVGRAVLAEDGGAVGDAGVEEGWLGGGGGHDCTFRLLRGLRE